MLIFPMSTTVRRWILLFIFSAIVFLFVVTMWPQTIYTVESFFEPVMSDTDEAVLRRTNVALVSALDQINATYFMASGTLLGSYRHHGHIPWDDDVDLIISTADKTRVYEALLALAPDYIMYLRGRPVDPMHWKLFSSTGTHKVPFQPFCWPFIDILFFDEDEHYVWNESPWFSDERWPKSAVFPLVKRPFNGLWLSAPCDTAAVLAVNFDVDECASRSRSHSYDVPFLTSVVVPCDTLRYRFPFVKRSEQSSTSGSKSSRLRMNPAGKGDEVESLMIGNRTLKELTVHSRCAARSLGNGRSYINDRI